MKTNELTHPDIWAKLAEKLPADAIQWRQQGKPKARNNGGFAAPFVAYTDAQTVRDRLDAVVPGEWDLSLELLPAPATFSGEETGEPCNFKATLSILGCKREDVGGGKDYKNAATDAFKRAAVRFGVGHELYTDYEVIWVSVDGDGKWAKPTEDPAKVWAAKSGAAPAFRESTALPTSAKVTTADVAQVPVTDGADPSCPKCAGRMWDNRLTKRNPKAPDFKCRDRSCDGVVWPEKGDAPRENAPADVGVHMPADDERNGDGADLPF